MLRTTPGVMAMGCEGLVSLAPRVLVPEWLDRDPGVAFEVAKAAALAAYDHAARGALTVVSVAAVSCSPIEKAQGESLILAQGHASRQLCEVHDELYARSSTHGDRAVEMDPALLCVTLNWVPVTDSPSTGSTTGVDSAGLPCLTEAVCALRACAPGQAGRARRLTGRKASLRNSDGMLEGLHKQGGRPVHVNAGERADDRATRPRRSRSNHGPVDQHEHDRRV